MHLTCDIEDGFEEIFTANCQISDLGVGVKAKQRRALRRQFHIGVIKETL